MTGCGAWVTSPAEFRVSRMSSVRLAPRAAPTIVVTTARSPFAAWNPSQRAEERACRCCGRGRSSCAWAGRGRARRGRSPGRLACRSRGRRGADRRAARSGMRSGRSGAPMNHPPRPSTSVYNDRSTALALRPKRPRFRDAAPHQQQRDDDDRRQGRASSLPSPCRARSG